MKKNYDTVILDLDGTIMDTSEGVIRSVIYALEKMKEPKQSISTLRKFIGPPLHAAFMDYCAMNEEQAALAVKYYRERYSTIGVLEYTPYPGIIEFIKEISRNGKKIAVATGKPEKYARIILEKEGIMDCIEFITTPTLQDTKDIKPLLIRRCLDALGGNAVMIGDRDLDINGAIENGIDSIGAAYGFGTREELSRATYIAENVDEIKRIVM